MESPSWSGLPLNVEKLIRERQTVNLIANMKVLQGTGEDLMTVTDEIKSNMEKEGKAAWLIKLAFKVDKMFKSLPL